MKIAIVGVGTAGLMSLCHFLAHSPKGTTVTAVYDPAIDILVKVQHGGCRKCCFKALDLI